eukprot:1061967-Amorphochlora_amoeboformis.AAC.1
MASSRQSGPEEASACSQGDTDVPIRAQRNDLSMSLSGNIGGCPQCAAQSCRTAEMAVKVSKLKKKISTRVMRERKYNQGRGLQRGDERGLHMYHIHSGREPKGRVETDW